MASLAVKIGDTETSIGSNAEAQQHYQTALAIFYSLEKSNTSFDGWKKDVDVVCNKIKKAVKECGPR